MPLPFLRHRSFLVDPMFNIERHGAAVQPYIAAPREPLLQPS
jgi:hypothetical protein